MPDDTTTEAPAAPPPPAATTQAPAPANNTTAAPAPANNTTAAPAPANNTTAAPAPANNTTAAPAGNTTAAPAGNTTAAPAGNTTAAPAGNTTAAPGGQTTQGPGITTTQPPGQSTTAPSGPGPHVDATIEIDPPDSTNQNKHSYQIANSSKLMLTWSATNAASVNITGVGDGQGLTGSVEIPTQESHISLVAVAADGTLSPSFDIDISTHDDGEVVSPHSDLSSGVAVVLSFGATKDGQTVTAANFGDQITLTAVVSEATDSCTISGTAVSLAESGGNKTGSVAITIAAPMNGDFDCQVSASGTAGDPGSLHLDLGAASAPSSTTTAPGFTTTQGPGGSTTQGPGKSTTLAPGGSTTRPPGSSTTAAAPQVVTFTGSTAADPSGQQTLKAESGAAVTLTWETTGATQVNIDNGVGTVDASGSITVNPTANTTYTLIAGNAAGVTVQGTVEVDIATADQTTPVIQFGALDSDRNRQATFNVTPGSGATLSWLIDGPCDSIEISGIDAANLGVDDERDVQPDSNTTYTLTAVRSGLSATASVTITVSIPSTTTLAPGSTTTASEVPKITVWAHNSEGEQIEQEELTEGGKVVEIKKDKAPATINWEVLNNPTQVAVTDQASAGPTGALVLIYDEEKKGQTLTYTFDASNSAGAAESVTVQVKHTGEGVKVSLFELTAEQLTHGDLVKTKYFKVVYSVALVGALDTIIGAPEEENDAKSWFEEFVKAFPIGTLATNFESAQWTWDWTPLAGFKAWQSSTENEHTVGQWNFGHGTLSVPSFDAYKGPTEGIDVTLGIAMLQIKLNVKAGEVEEPKAFPVIGTVKLPLVVLPVPQKSWTFEGEIALELKVTAYVDLFAIGLDAAKEIGEKIGEGVAEDLGGALCEIALPLVVGVVASLVILALLEDLLYGEVDDFKSVDERANAACDAYAAGFAAGLTGGGVPTNVEAMYAKISQDGYKAGAQSRSQVLDQWRQNPPAALQKKMNDDSSDFDTALNALGFPADAVNQVAAKARSAYAPSARNYIATSFIKDHGSDAMTAAVLENWFIKPNIDYPFGVNGGGVVNATGWNNLAANYKAAYQAVPRNYRCRIGPIESPT